MVKVTDLPHLKVGQAASVTPDGLGRTISGQVIAIGLVSTAGTTGTTYPVTIGLTDPTDGLRDAATATTVITTSSTGNALAVPTSAVHADNGRYTVTVLHGDTTEAVNVEVGPVGATWTAITSGLNAGDTVVLANVDEPLPSSATSSTNGQQTNPFRGTGGRTGAAHLCSPELTDRCSPGIASDVHRSPMTRRISTLSRRCRSRCPLSFALSPLPSRFSPKAATASRHQASPLTSSWSNLAARRRSASCVSSARTARSSCGIARRHLAHVHRRQSRRRCRRLRHRPERDSAHVLSAGAATTRRSWLLVIASMHGDAEHIDDKRAAPVVDLVVPVFNEAGTLRASIARIHSYLTERFPFTWQSHDRGQRKR